MQKIPRAFARIVLGLAVAPLAQAHPGHEGHELTWEFGHLVAHPGATIMCFSVLAGAAWVVWRATRSDGVRAVKRDHPHRDRR